MWKTLWDTLTLTYDSFLCTTTGMSFTITSITTIGMIGMLILLVNLAVIIEDRKTEGFFGCLLMIMVISVAVGLAFFTPIVVVGVIIGLLSSHHIRAFVFQ